MEKQIIMSKRVRKRFKFIQKIKLKINDYEFFDISNRNHMY